MSTIVEVEKLALDLSEQEWAALAAHLLDSLPGILSNEDEGIAEALRRDSEIETDSARAISLAGVGFVTSRVRVPDESRVSRQFIQRWTEAHFALFLSHDRRIPPGQSRKSEPGRSSGAYRSSLGHTFAR